MRIEALRAQLREEARDARAGRADDGFENGGDDDDYDVEVEYAP